MFEPLTLFQCWGKQWKERLKVMPLNYFSEIMFLLAHVGEREFVVLFLNLEIHKHRHVTTWREHFKCNWRWEGYSKYLPQKVIKASQRKCSQWCWRQFKTKLEWLDSCIWHILDYVKKDVSEVVTHIRVFVKTKYTKQSHWKVSMLWNLSKKQREKMTI